MQTLRRSGIPVGVVSNADSRIRTYHLIFTLGRILTADQSLACYSGDVLQDLDVASYFDVIVLSEEEGTEKPSPLIWQRACERIKAPNGGIFSPSKEVLHIGDELYTCVLHLYDISPLIPNTAVTHILSS